jgi:hypothetical protein
METDQFKITVHVNGRLYNLVSGEAKKMHLTTGDYVNLLIREKLIATPGYESVFHDTPQQRGEVVARSKKGSILRSASKRQHIQSSDSPEGLFICSVCGATEGECPGFKLTHEQKEDIYAGKIDYKDSKFVSVLQHGEIKQ